MLNRQEREEMNALSKEVFGVSSKWKSIMERGFTKVLTRKVTETVPGTDGAPDTEKEVEVPVLLPHGAKQSYTHRPSFDEIKKMMLDFKAQRDVMIEERNKQIAEQLAKKEQEALQAKIQKEIAGSAI